MFLEMAVVAQPEKLDHEPLLPLFHLTALTSEYVSYFQSRFFTPLGRKRQILHISLMNDIHILYDDKCKIGTKPPDAKV
jgi:hypothetical protein